MQRPGGQSSAPGEEVGSGYDIYVMRQRTATDGGGSRTEERIKKYPKTAETGGAGGGRIKC